MFVQFLAPESLKIISLSSNSLNVSWETPTLRDIEVLKAFNICYKKYPKEKSHCLKSEAGSSSFKIDLLKSSTMYEISVRLQTTIGESVSAKITKITNDSKYGKDTDGKRKNGKGMGIGWIENRTIWEWGMKKREKTEERGRQIWDRKWNGMEKGGRHRTDRLWNG